MQDCSWSLIHLDILINSLAKERNFYGHVVLYVVYIYDFDIVEINCQWINHTKWVLFIQFIFISIWSYFQFVRISFHYLISFCPQPDIHGMDAHIKGKCVPWKWTNRIQIQVKKDTIYKSCLAVWHYNRVKQFSTGQSFHISGGSRRGCNRHFTSAIFFFIQFYFRMLQNKAEITWEHI